MADEIQGMTVKVGITDEAFTGGISKINKAMSLLQSEFKASAEGLKGFGDTSQQLNNKSEYLNKALELQQQKVKALQEAYAKSKQESGEFANSTMSAGTKVNNAVAQLARLQNELKQVDDALKNDGKEVEEEGNAWTKLGEKIKSATSGMGEYIKQGIGLAIGGDIWDKAKETFGNMITFGSDLQVALNGVQTATGTSTEAMGDMKNVMVDIYNDNFGENFDDIAETMKIVSQATGATGEELKKLSENGLLLRDTFDIDVADSVKATSQLMQQFGVDGDTAYNLIAQGAQQGLNKNGDLVDLIDEYSVQFGKLGLSADDMFNIMKTGADNGAFSMDILGDGMKEFALKVVDGSKTTIDGFTQIGLDADEMANKFAQGGDSAKDAFNQTIQGLANIEDPLMQNQVGIDLFGTKWEDLGSKAVTSLANTTTSISSTKDALGSINSIQYNDLGSAFEGIKRNIETGILLPISEKVLPKLSEFSNWFVSNMPNIKDSVGGLADKIAPVFDVLGQAFTVIVSNLDTIIPIIITFGATFGALQIAGVIAMATTAFTTFKTAIIAGQGVMAAFNLICDANPISLIIISIGALVAGIIVMYNKVEWFRNGVNAIGTWLANFFTVTLPQAFNSVVTWFASLPAKATALWNSIKTSFNTGWNSIVTFFTVSIPTFFSNLWITIKQTFINGWNTIVNFFTTTIPAWVKSIGAWFAELPNKIMYGLGSLVGLLATWGVNVWTYFSTNIPIWITNICTFFSELPGKIWTFLVEVVTKFGKWGSNVISWIATNVVTWITNIVNFYVELPGKIWEFLVAVVTKLGEWGSNVISWVSTNVPIWINNIVTFFTELPGKIWTWLVNCVTNIGTWGTDMLTKAKEGMTKVFDGIVETFTNLPSKMLEIGTNIVNGIKDGIKGAWDGMTGWLGGLCDSFTQGVKDKFEIHSPSHIFRDEIGKMLAMGIGVGFENEMPTVNSNVSKTIDGTVKIANLASLDSLKNIDKTYSSSNKAQNQPFIINTTNITTLNGKVIAKETKKEVLKDITRATKSDNTSKGRSSLVYA